MEQDNSKQVYIYAQTLTQYTKCHAEYGRYRVFIVFI